MEVLNIEGVIGQKTDGILAPGDKVFSFEDLENFLASYGGGPFEAVIKSPGGSVEEGFKIYDKLKEYDVTTVALTANSIASVIFLAGKVRKITPSSQLIIHNAWISGEDLSGEKLNFHTLQALTQIFAETDLRILSVYSSVAGATKASKILALMAEETNLDTATALALGFATEVLEEDYAALAFRNRVVTYSRNYIELIALQDGPLTAYADVVYINEAGEVLLLQRTESDDFEPLKWGFPGGKVMQGETVEAGALREFTEETGIALEAVTLVKEVVNEDESLSTYFFAVGNEVPGETPEHAAAKFVALEDFDGLAFIKDQSERFKSIVNQILIDTKMKDEDKVGAFEKMLKGLKNLFKLQLKNMATTTSEGVAIFIAGAEEDGLLGKSVYLAEEGLPTETPAPAGSHVLEDGTTIVVDDAGLITEVMEAAPVEDVEVLKADFAATTLAMEEEKKQLEAKVAAQAKLIEDGNKKLEKLNADFLDLKNAVLGDPDAKKKDAAPADLSKMTPGERIKARAMAKAETI